MTCNVEHAQCKVIVLRRRQSSTTAEGELAIKDVLYLLLQGFHGEGLRDVV